jgi:beta-N-acetylhexosaminidase
VNLDEKVGQLFVVAAREDTPIAELEHFVRDLHAGGVIWFQTTTEHAARVNAHLQSIALVPLLISADLEAGMGMRFTDAEWAPPAMAIAATGDPMFAEEQGRETATAALRIGINHIFAPVADVNVHPRNPVINTRSFGEDPHDVARYVAAFVRGVQSTGCLATAKHFPGHGDTHIDSHRALPVLDVSRERLEQVELVPFRAAIEAGVASVMIGHLAVPALDDTPAPVRAMFEAVYGTVREEVTRAGTMPATLSKRVIDVLRNGLGFDGLVITDAMDMGGLAAHFDPADAAVRAIEAGEDQVVFSPDPEAAIAAVKARVSEARIDESVRRILRAKSGLECGGRSHRFGLFPRRMNIQKRRLRPPHSMVADLSITLVRDRNNLLPLHTTNIATVISAPHGDPIDIPFHADLESADVLLLLLAIRPRSGAGAMTIPEDIKQLAKRHAHKTIAVAYGSPYILRELGDISTFVCAWAPQPVMQRAAMRALRGEIAFAGRLPVRIE